MKSWIARIGVSSFGIGIFFSLTLGSSLDGYCASTPGAAETQLKNILIESQKKQGELEPWQRVIFSEEVVPQYQRFFKDYKASTQGIQADLDLVGLKNYLAFYAPKTLNQKAPKALVFLSTDSNCVRCTNSIPIVQKLAKSRLERRGLTPIFVTSDDIKANLGKSAEVQLEQLAQDRKSAGYLMIEWGPAAPDDSDTAHADENHYVLRVALRLGGFGAITREKDLLENDPFETAEARLLSDVITELGAKLQSEKTAVVDTDQEELLVELTGIQDYFHYLKVRGILQTKLKETTLIEDRVISRGRVVFSMHSNRPLEQLKREIAAIHFAAEGTPTVSWVNK
jgi:hypothetical protein